MILLDLVHADAGFFLGNDLTCNKKLFPYNTSTMSPHNTRTMSLFEHSRITAALLHRDYTNLRTWRSRRECVTQIWWLAERFLQNGRRGEIETSATEQWLALKREQFLYPNCLQAHKTCTESGVLKWDIPEFQVWSPESWLRRHSAGAAGSAAPTGHSGRAGTSQTAGSNWSWRQHFLLPRRKSRCLELWHPVIVNVHRRMVLQCQTYKIHTAAVIWSCLAFFNHYTETPTAHPV